MLIDTVLEHFVMQVVCPRVFVLSRNFRPPYEGGGQLTKAKPLSHGKAVWAQGKAPDGSIAQNR
jgi:hypothetical protein